MPEEFGTMKEGDKFDFVIIGAGHNALTCAGYLAKAGQKVIVLEYRDIIGGGCMTEEITGVPGFKHNTHSQMHGWITNGPVMRDLEIKKYGCDYVYPDPRYAAVFSDGRSLIQYADVDKTCEQVAKFSPRDARTYKEIYERFKGMHEFIMGTWYQKPIPYSQMFAALEEGGEGGWEMVKLTMESAADVLEEYFENEEVRTWLAMLVIQGVGALDTKGLGMGAPIVWVSNHDKPWGVCVGGSRSLPLAIARFIAAHGGVVLAGREVVNIIIENKVAKGVELKDGKRIMAEKAVVSSAGIKQTLLELLGESHLDDILLRKVKRYRTFGDVYSLPTPHLALNDIVRWKAAETNPDVNRAWNVNFGSDSLLDIRTQFDDMRERRLPRIPGGFACMPSLVDPTQAPPGKQTAFYWQFSIYTLDGDPENWDRQREEILEEWLARWKEYAPNLNDENIVAKCLYTPYDYEKTNLAMKWGDAMHGDVCLDQMYRLKPFYNEPSFKVRTVENLYLTGGGVHPTGGCTGAPGYNTANQIAEDLGIQKWWQF